MNYLSYELKNKNITQQKIIEILAKATKYDADISKIKLHNTNLCVFSYIYDNENLFLFLVKNFYQEFNSDLKNAIIFTYTNKNPQILKTSFSFLSEQTEEQKNELFNLFAQNCYRSENIEIVQSWLQKQLSINQQEKFIEKLFEYNNRPFLNFIAKIKFWKPLLQNYKKYTDESYYLRLLKEPLNNETTFKSELEISTFCDNKENVPLNKNLKPEKIVRKKKRVINI